MIFLLTFMFHVATLCIVCFLLLFIGIIIISVFIVIFYDYAVCTIVTI